MQAFEWIIVLLAAAAALAEVARRLGVPYPTLLALGGAGLALLPNGPQWVLDPELALALFVAPVLLDAAYDTSLRELRANWRPVTGLVVAAAREAAQRRTLSLPRSGGAVCVRRGARDARAPGAHPASPDPELSRGRG